MWKNHNPAIITENRHKKNLMKVQTKSYDELKIA